MKLKHKHYFYYEIKKDKDVIKLDIAQISSDKNERSLHVYYDFCFGTVEQDKNTNLYQSFIRHLSELLIEGYIYIKDMSKSLKLATYESCDDDMKFYVDNINFLVRNLFERN